MQVARIGFDPVEAARHDLARSRAVAASVAGDLEDFKHYLAAEQKKREQHARWMKHQQAVMRRREWRHRTMRSIRRALVMSAHAVRSAVLLVFNAFISALARTRDALVDAFLWTAGTARSLALQIYQAIAGGLAFARAKALALSVAIAAAMSAGTARITGTTRSVATDVHARIAAGFSWSRDKARSLALAGTATVSAAAHRTSRATQAAASTASARIASELSWSEAQGRAVALAGTRAVSAGTAVTAEKSQAALSAARRNTTAGSAWARANLGALRSAAIADAAWTAARSRSLAASMQRGFASTLAWSGDKARTSALIGAAAILTGVSAVTAATEAVTLATAEKLGAGADRLRTSATALAASLQAQALAWRNAIAARCDVFVPKLLDATATASCTMRATTLRCENALAAKVSLTKPALKTCALRAASLGADLRDRAKGELDRLSHTVLVPFERVLLSAPGSLHLQATSAPAEPSPAPSHTRNGTSAKAANGHRKEGEPSRALACIEPLRCNLPALPPPSARQLLASN